MTKKEFLEQANNACKTINGATTLDERDKAIATAENAIREYNNLIRDEVYAKILATKKPVIEAAKTLRFATKKVAKKTKELCDGSKIESYQIEPSEAKINLFALSRKAKKAGKTIGESPNWLQTLIAFSQAMLVARAREIGVDARKICDSVDVFRIYNEIENGNDPLTPEKFIETYQTVISEMIGEKYKITEYDVNYLRAVYSRKSKHALTLKQTSDGQVAEIILETCHKVLMNKSYEIEPAKKKS